MTRLTARSEGHFFVRPFSEAALHTSASRHHIEFLDHASPPDRATRARLVPNVARQRIGTAYARFGMGLYISRYQALRRTRV